MGVALEGLAARREGVLQDIVSVAGSDPRVRALLLVGSMAAGTDDAYSDIDVVVIAEPGGVASLQADRLRVPAQFGDVVLQMDSSWNVWKGASQVLTLFDGDNLPLWLDMDIWPASAAATPCDARVLVGAAPPPTTLSLSELATELKERHGIAQVACDNVEGVADVAWVAWGLKGIARGYGGSLADVWRTLEQPWPAELEAAREPLRRYADHVSEAATR